MPETSNQSWLLHKTSALFSFPALFPQLLPVFQKSMSPEAVTVDDSMDDESIDEDQLDEYKDELRNLGEFPVSCCRCLL